MNYERGKLYDVSIDDFRADPNQPRKVFDPDALAELTESIKKHGILEPILFRRDGDEVLYVVAGERRVEAARKAGLTHIPAIAVEGQTSEIALVENLLRQDLTAVEEAEALDRLMKEQEYNQEQLAEILGKSRQTITDILTLNRLPQDIRDECRGDRKISRATLIEIARKKQVRGMETAYKKYQDKMARQAAGRTKRTEVTLPAGDVLQWLDKTNSKLGSIDTAAWTEDERSAFIDVLTTIQGTILAILNPKPTEEL